jgi:hypothetical protein
MMTPDIYRDDESGDLDVFVPPEVTGALLEFLRGKVPFFGVTIESVESFRGGEDEAGADEPVETGDDAEDEDDGPLDAFSFPGEVDEDTLEALLEEFFQAR